MTTRQEALEKVLAFAARAQAENGQTAPRSRSERDKSRARPAGGGEDTKNPNAPPCHGVAASEAGSPASHSPFAAPKPPTPNSDLSRHSLQATPELQTLNSELRTLNCTQAKAAVEAVRADIEANGPDALRDLLRQTDALLGRMTHWTKCQRAARYRSLLVAYAASRQAEPPRHEDTKNPNENHAQLREAPGAARSSLPSVPPCPGGSPIPDSRDFASIRGGYDLVIPLGTGSRHDNLELRHLLRSALLHLDSRSLASIRGPSLRRIHIIGPQRPAWLADHPMIRWHQWKTLKPKNHDIVAKFIHAANHPDVAETFIGTCDDFLFLAPLLIEPQSRSERDKSHARPADGGEDTKNPNENPTQRREAPGAARLSPSFAPSRLSGSPIPDLREFASIRGSIHYGAVRHGGVLSTATDQGYWKNAQAQTRRLLDAAGYPHLFYDYHVPTVMTKTGWQKVAREIPWRSLPGHAVWSLYHNVAGVHGPVLGPDSHTGYHAGDGSRFPRTPDEIDRAAAGKLFLTYNDGGLQGGVMQTWLETHHPTPAPWEIVDREHAERADAPARSPGFSPLPSPGENPAQRREAPGAARLSLPFVPSCPGGSPVPDSRSSASIRGSLPSSPSWSSSLRGDEFLLCSFNTPYADYAAACIHSILSTNPGYTVHAFPTNVPADILAQYPFAHPAVVLHPETRPFKTPKAERNYMVCRRYVRYAEFIETLPDGTWIVTVDVDSLVLGSLSDLRRYMEGQADVALIDRGEHRPRHDRIRGHFTASHLGPGARRFWTILRARLEALPDKWWSDQRELLAAKEDATAQGTLFWPAWERHYCAFWRRPDTRILVTAGAGARKLTRSPQWAEAYAAAAAQIAALRKADDSPRSHEEHEEEPAQRREAPGAARPSLPSVPSCLSGSPSPSLPPSHSRDFASIRCSLPPPALREATNHTNATKKPNENPAPRRETPGAARSSLPVPHSRDFASIRGSISYPRDLDILVVLYGHSLPRAAAVAATFAKWHRYQQPMPRVLCAWCYKPGNAPGELAKLPPYPWLEKILLPQYDLDDGVFRKEGLLNHLLRDHAAAPYILTLDADVWTPRRNWFRSIRDKLAENPDHVLQPFRYFKDTKENVGAYSWSAQTLPDTNPAKCHHPGLGWAFTREWVRKHGKETVFNPWHPIAMGDHAFAQEHALGPKKWIAMKYFSRVARKGLPSGRLAGVQAKVWHENHTNHAAVLQESKGSPFADRAYRWGCEGLGSWGDLAKHLVMDENGIPLLRDQKGPFAAFLRRKTEMQTEEAMHRLVSDCLHPKNNAVFCAFNAPFVGYAAVLIHSVLTNSPGWCIHAFATNVSADELGRYPFNHSLVTIHAETREFGNKEEERCYMASYRFLRYLDVLEQVAFAVYLDVDQVVLCSLDEAIAATGAADLGIIFRPHLQDRYRAIMCATVAVRPTPGAVTYWRQYQRRLADSLEWMGDQLHMIEAVEDCGDSVRCASLPESVWNSFDAGTSVRVLCTRTEDKLGFRRGAGYARHFRRLSAEVAARRDASQVALVYVVFGSDGARLDAIRKGIAETAATVDLPGVVLVLDAGTAPVVADLAATLPGAVYRHLPTGPRHVGCWQKEALWEVARKMLVGFPAIKQAVFLDADCVPLARDFFARVQQLHSAGIKAAQPWRLCRDTVEETIGGMSTCWGVAEEGKKANFWGSQPGFCWSFDLDWLARFGGLPNVEPLGGGDSLLMNLVFSAACGWSPEAEHMQALARAGKVPRQPCAALPVDLKHHTHGPRANRGYHLRYQVAIQCLGNVLSVFERDENGLWRVQDGGIGTAWLTMMERRGEWTCDETSYIRLWSEVRAR